ncbi:hypothetical protein K4A76_20265 [Pseudomonas sp. NEEL19]|uniref:hypothetical protein n=1 Tax=Pseudomonas sp. NEEL19 TaxID=2867409 RepID=UPI0023687D9A|nr:hypothetical protein [Pseudomonas sp. NEEL19]WDM58748.1 hypothetical protein K4A76_20265 [Pseudomonas sp. NEEL19]
MEPKELDKPDQAAADSAAGPIAQPGRSYAGILVHRGVAPLNNDPNSKNAYALTVKTTEGEVIFADPGFAELMESTPVQVGAPVRLDPHEGGWRVQQISAEQLQAFNANAGSTHALDNPQAAGNDSARNTSAAPDPDALDALMKVAAELKATPASLDPEEVRRIDESLNERTKAAPQREHGGAATLLQGSAELLGGVASLTGAAMHGIGKGASALADAWREGSKAGPVEPSPGLAESEEMLGRVQVLPRLSEYRVDQVEKAAGNYAKAHAAFWSAGTMPQVLEQIEARAGQAGLSVPEVIEKMKPDGEFTDLHHAFTDAVAQSPDAQGHRKAMDKALTGWARQYGRAQEELLNPETEGNAHYDKLKARLETSCENIHDNASKTPAFEGEAQSHLERLQASMQRIFERLKEMMQGIVNMVGNKAQGNSQDNDMAP